MFNLIRADLFRVTRTYRLRGEFLQYALWLAALIALIVGLTWFVASQLVPAEDRETLDFLTPGSSITTYFGMSFVADGPVALFASFAMVQIVFADLTDGFTKSVIASMRGRLAYGVGKIALAGIWSAGVLAAACAFCLVGAIVTGWIDSIAIDSAPMLALWFVQVWLCCWALAVISLVLVWATRIKPLSYGFALICGIGLIPMTLRAVAASNGGALAVLSPIAPALRVFADWCPSSILSRLTSGMGSFLETSRMAAGAISGQVAAQGIIVALLWLVLGSAAFLMVMRRRDV